MTNTERSLRHDLSGVVGNLKAIEFLLFSTPATTSSNGIQETYRNLIGKLDDLLKRMDDQTKSALHGKEEKSAE